MTMDDILKKVQDFADHSHGEQQRRYEKARYIVHPVRVMETCRQFTNDITILSAALLHDVLEDTPVTRTELYDFLLTAMNKDQASRTTLLVEELTDVFTKANYPQYKRRQRKDMEAKRVSQTSADAQTIKYADIIDNIREITEQDPDFARVFLSEYRSLLKRIPKGNEDLYKTAVSKLNEEIKKSDSTSIG